MSNTGTVPDYVFEYTEDGNLVGIKTRTEHTTSEGGKEIEHKTFSWYTPEGYTKGQAGLNGRKASAMPLFGRDEMLVRPDLDVLFVEGEKKVLVLRQYGYVSVSLPVGASQKQFGSTLEFLRGRSVILIPDNDEEGREFMRRVAHALDNIAAKVKWLEFASVPEHYDIVDFFQAGRSSNELDIFLDKAPLYMEYAQNFAKECQDNPKTAKTEDGTLWSVGRYLMSEVTPEKVEWLFNGRIPLRKTSLWVGDPGVGKGATLIDLIARVTTGREMPDGTPNDLDGPASVLILSAEDDVNDTIALRLIEAGADLSKVIVRKIVQDGQGARLPTIPDDLEAIREDIWLIGAKWVIVDPIIAYLGDANAYVDQQVRAALAPLEMLAVEEDVAVTGVMHLNKYNGGNAIQRTSSSIAFTAAARCSTLLGKDPNDTTGMSRALVPIKSNAGRLDIPALRYHVESGEKWDVAKVHWDGPCELTADDLLAQPSTSESGEEKSRLADAKAFLETTLAEGPVKVAEIDKAAKALHIAHRTLTRAKNSLCVKAEHIGFSDDSYWQWYLPKDAK